MAFAVTITQECFALMKELIGCKDDREHLFIDCYRAASKNQEMF